MNLPTEEFVTSGNVRSCASPGPTPGSPPSPYRQVSELSVYASIEQFQQVLGPEMMRTGLSDGITEYLFVSDEMAVRAITDKDDSVAFYAVTTMSPEFCPYMRYWLVDDWTEVCLGKTKFADLPQTDGVRGWAGAQTVTYFEQIYLANPGNYQTIIFSNSDANQYHDWGPIPDAFWSPEGLVDGADPQLPAFRQGTVVDTVGFTAPNVDVQDLEDAGVLNSVGADMYLLRVLPDFDYGFE